MLCYVRLCYVMCLVGFVGLVGLVRLCSVMLCCVVVCYVVLCYVMLWYVFLCYAMLCCVVLCYVMLCYGMLCYLWETIWGPTIIFKCWAKGGNASVVKRGLAEPVLSLPSGNPDGS